MIECEIEMNYIDLLYCNGQTNSQYLVAFPLPGSGSAILPDPNPCYLKVRIRIRNT